MSLVAGGVVDAHVHVWDLAVRDQEWIAPGSPIRRTFSLCDLHQVVAGTDVESVVLVQVINDPDETAEFLDHARTDPLVAGVVGWIDLARPDIGEALPSLAENKAIVGIRHQALAEGDPAGWLRSPGVQRGLSVLEALGLPFDLMFRPEHFPAVFDAVRAHPSLPFVLDHLGKAPIAAGRLEPWASGLRRLASEENVHCKISGVHTIAGPDWTFRDIAPFAQVALDAFTPARTVFGSDWPVSLQVATYAQVLDVAVRLCAQLSEWERAAVLGGNARTLYGLA